MSVKCYERPAGLPIIIGLGGWFSSCSANSYMDGRLLSAAEITALQGLVQLRENENIL